MRNVLEQTETNASHRELQQEAPQVCLIRKTKRTLINNETESRRLKILGVT